LTGRWRCYLPRWLSCFGGFVWLLSRKSTSTSEWNSGGWPDGGTDVQSRLDFVQLCPQCMGCRVALCLNAERMRVCCLPSVAVCGLPCSAQSILRSTTMAVYPEETRYALSLLWLPFLTQKNRMSACRVGNGRIGSRRTRYGAWASSVCVFFFLLFSFESWWMLLPVGLCHCALRSGGPEYILWRTLGSWARL
jgi:hypothetical protein